MNLSLPTRVQKLIEDRVRSGQYRSAEDVIAAALTHLDQQEQASPFAAGELDALLSEGDTDIERGDVLEADAVFEQLRRMSAERKSTSGDAQ